MAITKQINYMGFDTDEYVKISGAEWKEDGTNSEGNKLYSVELQVDRYTNSSKEYMWAQEKVIIGDLLESELSIAIYYEKLKSTEEFSGYTDA